MQDSKINPLWKVLNENHDIKLPSDKDYTCLNTGIDNSTDTESPARDSEKVFASDFDRIVSEGPNQLAERLGDMKDIDRGIWGMTSIYNATKGAPNPAPLKDEKK